MRTIAISTAVLALATSPLANAEEANSDFAENSVTLGVSPFGGSISYAYAFNERTTIQGTIGGLPSSELLDFDIEGTTYAVTSGSSWAGGFINHRPVANADWFRLNFGVGFGIIRNTLVDGDGNAYDVNYTESPVAYTGIGFGFKPKKGLQYGFDFGALFGGGATINGDAANSGEDASEDIAASPLAADVLPNIQLGIGWGF